MIKAIKTLSYAETVGGSESLVEVLTFSPPVDVFFRCANVTFGDDDLVEAEQRFAVVVRPVNSRDRFPSGNQITFTIVDDDGEFISQRSLLLG